MSSRASIIQLSKSSFVKLPVIDKSQNSRLMLEKFGMKKRSVSKTKVYDNDGTHCNSYYETPQKINNQKQMHRTVEKYIDRSDKGVVKYRTKDDTSNAHNTRCSTCW